MANPGKILRAIGIGASSIDVFPPPIIASRAPTSSDTDYPLGQKWIYSSQEYTFMGGGTWDEGGVGAATTTTYGVVLLDTDGTFASADNDHVPTVLAAKTYIDGVAIAGAPDASTTTKGIIEIATNVQAVAASSSDLAIVPSSLAAVLAAPSAIGGTTPAGGAFTTLSATGAFSLSGDQVQVAEGGTGASSLTDHGLMVGSGTSAVTVLGVGTTGQLLVGASGADPAWATNIDLPGTLDVTGATTLDSTLDVAGAVTLTDQIDIDNININGNTISTTDTDGDLNLTPDGSGVVAASELTLTTDLAVAHGGTGASTFTDHGVLVGSGTSAITALSVGTNGQLLVGSTGADPAFATAASADNSVAFTLGANTIDFAVDESYLQVATVSVNASEINALATTPKTLVAAPGSDKVLLFESAMIILEYGTTPWTESDDNLGIKYTDASGVQVSEDIEMTGFITQTSDYITNAVPVKDAIVAASGAVNQALVLDNLGSNFGNSGDSTFTIRIAYRVVTAGL